MKFWHLFEFMDLEWAPASLRATLREILECGNGRPFRGYYDWVVDEAKLSIARGGYRNVVELGAGTAPITRRLAADPAVRDVRVILCDARPERRTYDNLHNRYAGRAQIEQEAVDFSEPHNWPSRTVLLLSATFHHIPPACRSAVLATLTDTCDCVMIFEPLRKTVLSVLFVLFSTVPSLLTPLRFVRRPGTLRRLLWCWLVPIAPVLFWWDGIISCLRMSTDVEWHELAGSIPSLRSRRPAVASSLFCQMVTVSRRDDQVPTDSAS